MRVSKMTEKLAKEHFLQKFQTNLSEPDHFTVQASAGQKSAPSTRRRSSIQSEPSSSHSTLSTGWSNSSSSRSAPSVDRSLSGRSTTTSRVPHSLHLPLIDPCTHLISLHLEHPQLVIQICSTSLKMVRFRHPVELLVL